MKDAFPCMIWLGKASGQDAELQLDRSIPFVHIPIQTLIPTQHKIKRGRSAAAGAYPLPARRIPGVRGGVRVMCELEGLAGWAGGQGFFFALGKQ
eukprot:gene11564-biopygen16876